MLSIKFKDGERVMVGENLTICVECVGRREVRLHFDDPLHSEIPVLGTA